MSFVPFIADAGGTAEFRKDGDFFVTLGMLVYLVSVVSLSALASKTVRKSDLEGSPAKLGVISVAVLAAYVLGITGYIASILRSGL